MSLISDFMDKAALRANAAVGGISSAVGDYTRSDVLPMQMFFSAIPGAIAGYQIGGLLSAASYAAAFSLGSAAVVGGYLATLEGLEGLLCKSEAEEQEDYERRLWESKKRSNGYAGPS